MEDIRIGIDLGGTKTELIALDERGRELLRHRRPSGRHYAGTLETIGSMVDEAEAELGRTGTVGVGIPGTLSPVTGLVKNANSTWLIGQALDADLARRLDRPVRLMNDANCFALSEAVDGAAAGAASVFGAILGTGVGGGIVLGGRVVEGADWIAGEWGHNPLPWPRDDERPGPACWCGKRGCIERFCSGPGMERDYLRALEEARDATERGSAGPGPGGLAGAPAAPTAREIAAAARRGDPVAMGTLDRYVDRLSRSLATVINLLDPEVVVLGGGVSNMPGLPERVQEGLGPWVFSDRVAARVVRHQHGDSSGVRGAAWLWPREQ